MPPHLARVTLDDDVATLADLPGFRRNGVRSTGVGAGEIVVVQLVLSSHIDYKRSERGVAQSEGVQCIRKVFITYIVTGFEETKPQTRTGCAFSP